MRQSFELLKRKYFTQKDNPFSSFQAGIFKVEWTGEIGYGMG